LIASYGTREIAANAVANTVDMFACVSGTAFCLAAVTVIGKAVGAGEEQQIRYYVGKIMKMGYAAHILWGICVFALTPFILQCFSKIDVETRQLAWYLILIHNGLGMLMWPGSFLFPNVLRAMNDVRVTMLISVISMLVVRVGSSYLIASWINSGVLAVWIAMVFDWIVRITGFCWRYKSNAWLALAHIKK
jgi:Na+-driven multidrug efflux pump